MDGTKEELLGFHRNTSLDIRREKKKKRDCKVKERLQTLFKVGVCTNGCDNSSGASAMSAVKSTHEVSSTSDDNQPSTSSSTENTNPSSLQDDLQTSEPEAKWLKSGESTQPNSIPTFPQTQGFCSQLQTLLLKMILVCGQT